MAPSHAVVTLQVNANDCIGSTTITYALAQSLSILTISPPALECIQSGAGPHTTISCSHLLACELLQDADWQQGTVHLPPIFLVMLYSQLHGNSLHNELQALMSTWSTAAPHVIDESTREHHDAAMLRLRCEIEVVVNGVSDTTLGRLIPMQVMRK